MTQFGRTLVCHLFVADTSSEPYNPVVAGTNGAVLEESTVSVVGLFGQPGFTKHALDVYDEKQELVVNSNAEADSINNRGQEASAECPDDKLEVTVVVEPVEHLTSIARGVSDETFEITWDIYQLSTGTVVPTDKPLSELVTLAETGEATLLSAGGHLSGPVTTCASSSHTYALQLFVEDGNIATGFDDLDSFLYVIGPCNVGCFQPHYVANGGEGCVLASISSHDAKTRFITFQSTELRDALETPFIGTRRYVLEADIAMAAVQRPFVVLGNRSSAHPLSPGLPQRVILTSGEGCWNAGGDDSGRCTIDGQDTTALFQFGADIYGDDGGVHNEVLVVDGLILANGFEGSGCGGTFKVRTGALVIVRNTLITGSKALSGGVICAYPSIYAGFRVLFANSQLQNNVAHKDIADFSSSQAPSGGRRRLQGHLTMASGSVLLCGYCTAVIRQCRFENNLAGGRGGVLFIDWRVSLWIYDSAFLRNVQSTPLTRNGYGGVLGGSGHQNGTLYIEGSHFEGNSADSGGGAIRVSEIQMHVVNSSFINNSALGSPSYVGGAPVVGGGITVTNDYSGSPRRFPMRMEGCHFIGNAATSLGGALHISDIVDTEYSSRRFNILDCVFINNTAEKGGALVLTSDVSVLVLSTTFTRNRAEDQAGGLLVQTSGDRGSTVDVTSSLFSGNQAPQ
eukprot:gene21891-26360_t